MWSRLREGAGWSLAIAVVLVIVATATVSGKYPLALADLWRVLWQPGAVQASGAPDMVATVFWQIRLPRIAAGLIIGAALAVAGAAYQGMFRNPLVSPDILGVSSGAGLGAVLGIFLGLPMLAVQGMAFVGGLLAVGLVCWIASWVRRHDAVLVLVLSGVVVGALLGAGISLVKVLADPYTQLPSITFWLLGGLNAITPADVQSLLPAMLFGLLPMVLLRWRINLLSLSDEEATALGVNVRLLRALMIVAATLMTAAAVSVAGIIGWVGLIIPHVARLCVGPGFSRLLPASLLMGAGFLVLADTLARTVASIELPLGIITALVGAPFFLFILISSGRRE